MNKYDLIVIGGGAGGITAAKTAHGLGKRVALVEKTNRLGGECTWTGCVPSKALIKVAEIAYYTHHLDMFGLQANINEFDTKRVMNFVRSIVHEVASTHTPDKIRQEGIDVFLGEPSFVDRHTIVIGDTFLHARKYVITTGSYPFVPPIEGIEDVDYLTNETLFNLDYLPRSMIILGGGPIGAEMASALNRLGVKIFLIEMQDRILPKEDQELVAMLTDTLRHEGVNVLTNMRATKTMQERDLISVECEHNNGGKQEVKAEKLLVAVGRRPNIEGLGLEKIGVETSQKGIVVDKTLKTTVKTIYAAGDVVGPYLFSHLAWYQAVTAVRNAFIPIFKKHIDYHDVIWVTFTAPELATAGLTENKARELFGDTIQVYKKAYADIDRAYTDRTRNGLAKFVCDKKGRLLGVHILGARAGDIIHEPQLAKVYGIKFADIQPVIHAYPTYSELVWHASKRAYIDRLEGNIVIRLAKKLFMRS